MGVFTRQLDQRARASFECISLFAPGQIELPREEPSGVDARSVSALHFYVRARHNVHFMFQLVYVGSTGCRSPSGCGDSFGEPWSPLGYKKVLDFQRVASCGISS